MPLVSKASPQDEPRPNVPLTPAEQEVANILRTHDGDLRKAAMTNAVNEAIDARNVERVVEAFPWDASAQVINQTAGTFGEVIRDNIGSGFPKVGFKGRFDFTDPRTIEYASTQSAQLVTAVTDTTRNIIRETVAEAFTKNETVYNTARKLRNVIGLNDRQAISFGKFQSDLMAKVSAKEITNDMASKLIQRQYDKMIRYRSTMIARHEILVAENHGRYLGFQQSIEQGWADPKSMKRWSTSTDERTCDICMPMNGKSVQWNQPYPNGVFNPPAHIMCRCSISLLEPDSSLAQNFMPPAKMVNVLEDIPMPQLPIIPVGNLRSPEQALEDIGTNNSGVSTFQYDAGQIENLNVSTESIIFNGGAATELRMRLTGGSKTRLVQEAERSIARDDGKWHGAKGFLIIDRKDGKKLKFTEVPDGEMDRRAISRTVFSETPDGAAFVYETASSATYTAYRANGTAIRIVVSKGAYSYDGITRIIIPGKATRTQIDAAMKEIGITAARLPSAQDIEKLRDNRLISLFNPNFGTALEKAPISIREEVLKITKKYGFTLDEVTTEIDSDGALRFLLPERVAKKLLDDSNIKSIKHALGGYLDTSAAEQTERVVALFTTNTKLQSQTQRKTRGSKGYGISEMEDAETGGADYVFVRPSTSLLEDAGEYNGTMVFQPLPLFRRTDYFGYSADSYGVKNPNLVDRYLNTKQRPEGVIFPDTFEEILNANSRSEMMFQHTIDTKDLYSITVLPEIREDVIAQLKKLGITEWNGRKIEDVIILPQAFR